MVQAEAHGNQRLEATQASPGNIERLAKSSEAVVGLEREIDLYKAS